MKGNRPRLCSGKKQKKKNYFIVLRQLSIDNQFKLRGIYFSQEKIFF